MKTILVLSPHLDDAAFSVGPVLAELSSRVHIVVATAFTKSEFNLSDFALACQLDKGLPKDVDYMAIRRQEDMEWSKRIGVKAVHGAFAEAPHRGYRSAKELFGPLLACDQLDKPLTSWLKNLIFTVNPSTVLCPIGLGNHVDHQWIRKVASTTFGLKWPLFFFKDQPYAAHTSSDCPQHFLGNESSWRDINVPFSKLSVDKARFAAEAYESQIPFQFGHVEKMREFLSGAWMQALPLFHTNVIASSNNLYSPSALDLICQD